MPGMVNTVLGAVDTAELGLVLPHEHLFINEMPEQRNIGLVNDATMLLDELRQYRESGGSTIVDVTTASLSDGADPDPEGVMGSGLGTGRRGGETRSYGNVKAVQRLSEASGINIVIGTGQYREPYLDADWVNSTSVSEIAATFAKEITEGIGESGVKAGIIGEIASDKWFISALEERCFRGAGRAQAMTGAAVTTHAARWPIGLAQLDLLEEEGADPSRVIIGHCDSVNIPAYHVAIAKRGAYVEFDSIRGVDSKVVELRIQMISNMIERGFLDQLLLSHDNCYTSHFHAGGGTGFDYIPSGFAAVLLNAGVTKDEFHQMTVVNPRRALAGIETKC